jgi:hypothetical protein
MEEGKKGMEEEIGSQPSIEERLQGLNLVGEEEEELDFSGEIDELIKDVRWLAIFRVHTTKPFSHAALMNAMRIAWLVARRSLSRCWRGTFFSCSFSV